MSIRIAAVLCLLAAPAIARPQTNLLPPFLVQLLTTIPIGTPLDGIHLEGRAQYAAGSLHETGTAVLDAKRDGTSTITLGLVTASSTETYSALSSDRTCNHTDRSGKVSAISKVDCLATVPWFSPILMLQDSLNLSNLLAITDGSSVIRSGSTLHDLTWGLIVHGRDTASTDLLVNATNMHVLFDPTALQASSLEYTIHPDGDLLKPIDVRIVFSDYRNTSGVMLPYHIERYVNRSLFLTIDVDLALLN